MKTIDIPLQNVPEDGPRVAHIPAYYLGKYIGVHKELSPYSTPGTVLDNGRYCVTHITTGMWLRKYDKLADARAIAKQLDTDSTWGFGSVEEAKQNFECLRDKILETEREVMGDE